MSVVGEDLSSFDKFLNIKEKIASSLLKAGELVKDSASSICPVDTGNLSSSITAEISDNRAVVGTDVSYGVYVEFGTGQKGTKGGRQTPWVYQKNGKFYTTTGQAPQPFMVPALKNNIANIVELFKEGLT